jgi:hypothetical protein
MSGQATDAQAEWVSRVLGVARPGGGSGTSFATRWPRARNAWQDASDTIDGQIAKLQQALRNSPDEDLQAIAEFGLNALTGNHKVRIMAGIRDVDGSGGAPAARDKLAALVEAFSRHIASDERVMACDENPLGVPMSIRATLGGALAEMQSVLGGA